MEFTKLGKVYIKMDEILYVLDEGVASRVTIVFRGGGTLEFYDAQANAVRAWLSDKVKEELPVENWDEE